MQTPAKPPPPPQPLPPPEPNGQIHRRRRPLQFAEAIAVSRPPQLGYTLLKPWTSVDLWLKPCKHQQSHRRRHYHYHHHHHHHHHSQTVRCTDVEGLCGVRGFAVSRPSQLGLQQTAMAVLYMHAGSIITDGVCARCGTLSLCRSHYKLWDSDKRHRHGAGAG